MSMFLIGSVVGLFAGASLGIIMMAIFVAGSQADDTMGEEQYK